MSTRLKIENHPIWDVHDQHRTARLNVKYYCRKLKHLENRDRGIDVISAVTTPSAVAGLAFWQDGNGKLIWGLIGALTSILATTKPFLRYSDRIRKLEEVIADYRRIEHNLSLINTEARETNEYSDRLKIRFKQIMEDYGKVKEKMPKTDDNKVLLKKCSEEVIKELPASYYFVPVK